MFKKNREGTIKELWIDTFKMPRVQIKPISCLDLVIPNFKREESLGGNIINKKSISCVLDEDLNIINIQQNQQQ